MLKLPAYLISWPQMDQHLWDFCNVVKSKNRELVTQSYFWAKLQVEVGKL